jgi:type IV secretory pathway VirB2 component (pilin)
MRSRAILSVALFVFSFIAYAAAQDIIPIGMKQSNIDTLKDIIFGVSVGVAVLMIVLNGLKWMTSDDEGDRAEAKTAMIYAGVALLILMLAGALVGLMFSAPGGY